MFQYTFATSNSLSAMSSMVAYRYHSKFAKDFTKKLFN